MLIDCPQCQARYDFPAEELPGEGLRAKCATCGFVMLVTPEGVSAHPDAGDFDDVSTMKLEAPTPAPTPAPKGRGRSRAPVVPAAAEGVPAGWTPAPAEPRRPGRALSAPPSSAPPIVISSAAPPIVVNPAEIAPPVVAATAPTPFLDAIDTLTPEPAEPTPPPALEADGGVPVAAEPLDLPRNAPRRPGTVPEADTPPRRTRTRVERPVPSEPSIIVDMTALAPPPGTAPAEAPPVEDAGPEFPDPFELEPLGDAPPAPATDLDVFGAPYFDEAEAVRPPGIRRLVLLLAVALVVGAALFVLWRNHWHVAAPGQMLDVALSGRPAPASVAPPPVEIAPETPVVGKLEVRGLKLERLARRQRAVLVEGELANGTNVEQAAITIQVDLAKNKLLQKTRVVACCDELDRDAAAKLAEKPEHPHFDERLNDLGRVRLKPGETRRFGVVFRELDGDLLEGDLVPSAQVRFSEPVRTP